MRTAPAAALLPAAETPGSGGSQVRTKRWPDQLSTAHCSLAVQLTQLLPLARQLRSPLTALATDTLQASRITTVDAYPPARIRNTPERPCRGWALDRPTKALSARSLHASTVTLDLDAFPPTRFTPVHLCRTTRRFSRDIIHAELSSDGVPGC